MTDASLPISRTDTKIGKKFKLKTAFIMILLKLYTSSITFFLYLFVIDDSLFMTNGTHVFLFFRSIDFFLTNF